MSWHTPKTDLGTHICIKLIQLVKQHPMIYLSSKEQSYPRKNRNKINQTWDDIAGDIGLSVEDCKRRWKGLKDVYAKIRKRRLQEGVLGLKARKKWLYEDFMTFMKFPFEDSYKKALENFEEVDCSEWKLEYAESNDALEETLNDSSDYSALSKSKGEEDSKNESQEQMEDGTIEYLDLDLEVDSVPDSEGYDSIQSLEKDDSSENKTQVELPASEENSGRSTGVKLRPRFRAIRPKPYEPNLSRKMRNLRNRNVVVKRNTSSTNPTLNLSDMNASNQMIVTTPNLRRHKNCDKMILTSPTVKVKNEGKETGDGVSSTSPGAMKVDSIKNSSFISNKSQSPLRLSPKKSNTNSVELFFQSMAQTVMTLPIRAQAEIKMEICKVVTKAEMQYSLCQSSSKLESPKGKGKKG